MTVAATQHLRLNPLDHFPPSNYNFFVKYFPIKDGVTTNEVFDVIHESIRRLFRELPYLSGRVWEESPDTPGWRQGQLEIRYNTDDFEGDKPLRHLSKRYLDPEELGFTFEDLRETGFPLDAFEDEQLIGAGLLPRYEDGPDCFIARANFLPGALLLVSGTQHAVCDGTSYFDVAKVWAGHCEALQMPGSPLPKPIPVESADRALLDDIWEKEGTKVPMDKVEPISWHLLDLQRPGSPRPEAAKSLKILAKDSMKAGSFYISPDKFSALRKYCKDTSSGTSRISGNDALTALIWRGMLKAKYKASLAAGRIKPTDVHHQARLFAPVDGRPNISESQALPMQYLGNLFFVHIIRQPLLTLVGADEAGTSLGNVAETIRTVAEKATHKALQDAYTLAKKVDDLNKIRLNRGHTPGSLDVVISSFLMFPYQDVKWGDRVFANGGVPYALRPLMRRFSRASQFCFVMPRRATGGVEFILTLYEDEMQLLLEDQEFSTWAKLYSF